MYICPHLFLFLLVGTFIAYTDIIIQFKLTLYAPTNATSHIITINIMAKTTT